MPDGGSTGDRFRRAARHQHSSQVEPCDDTTPPGHAGPALDLRTEAHQLTTEIDELTTELTARVQVLAPSLLAVHGCGVLTAAKILGETAGVDRFTSKDAFARHNGSAPLPVWSSNRARRSHPWPSCRRGRFARDLTAPVTPVEPTLVVEAAVDTARDHGVYRHPMLLRRVRADLRFADLGP